MASWSISSSKSGSARAERALRLKGDRVSGALPPAFFGRDTARVARELLGKVVVVRSRVTEPLESPGARVTLGRIVETEAYQGGDAASHSCRGMTPRNAIMFGEPGRVYVYFIYGMYEMLNFVTERKGYPGAVLIRAVEPLAQGPHAGASEALMRRRRQGRPARDLTNGPGRLCQAMGIRLSHKGESLAGPAIYVADDGCRPESVSVSPRVGIRQGTDVYWRFFVTGNPYVSRAPENARARREG